VAIWKRGMGYVAERPLLGLGPDNFTRRSASGRMVTRASFMATHNTFLQIWTEMGTLGLCIFVGIIIRGSWSLIALRRRLPRHWVNGTSDERFLFLLTGYVPVAFMGFSASAFFVTHGYSVMYYVLVAFLSGLLLLVKRKLKEDSSHSSRRASPTGNWSRRPTLHHSRAI